MTVFRRFYGIGTPEGRRNATAAFIGLPRDLWWALSWRPPAEEQRLLIAYGESPPSRLRVLLRVVFSFIDWDIRCILEDTLRRR